MLSKRLKRKALHSDAEKEHRDKHGARKMLSSSVEQLVMMMVAVEHDDIYTREEIERLVIRMMERHEQKLYGMDKKEFDSYLGEKMINAMAGVRTL